MAPIRQFALALGVVLTLIGILGYFDPVMTRGGTATTVPGADESTGLLLGLFAVNNVHNLVHVGSGLLGIAAGLISWRASRLFAQVFGIVYGLIALIGVFSLDGTMFLGILPLNLADTLLHAVISIASLYFGFSSRFAPSTAEA